MDTTTPRLYVSIEEVCEEREVSLDLTPREYGRVRTLVGGDVNIIQGVLNGDLEITAAALVVAFEREGQTPDVEKIFNTPVSKWKTTIRVPDPPSEGVALTEDSTPSPLPQSDAPNGTSGIQNSSTDSVSTPG